MLTQIHLASDSVALCFIFYTPYLAQVSLRLHER